MSVLAFYSLPPHKSLVPATTSESSAPSICFSLGCHLAKIWLLIGFRHSPRNTLRETTNLVAVTHYVTKMHANNSSHYKKSCDALLIMFSTENLHPFYQRCPVFNVWDLQILSANIRTNDFKLEMMFYCGFVVGCLVFPSLLTTDTAKHYLERERPHLIRQTTFTTFLLPFS